MLRIYRGESSRLPQRTRRAQRAARTPRLGHHDSGRLLEQVEAEGVEDVGVGGGDAVLFGYYAEVGLVVPHGPADVVLFEGDAHIVQPLGARGRRGELAEDAEFATVDGDVVEGRPLGCVFDGVLNALVVPTVFSIVIEEELAGEGGLFVELRGYVFGS